MAVSKNFTALLNVVTLISSIPVVSVVIWLASKPDNDCIRWLRWPFLVIGAALLLIALAGFLGAYFDMKGLLSVYLVCMSMLIVLVSLFLVIASIVTRRRGDYSVPGAAFREYDLEGYSSWFREQVVDGDNNWLGIRACLIDSGTCDKLNRKLITASQFYASDLSPIQSGCCKPPVACGFQYWSPTTWMGTSNTLNADCAIWSNDPSFLCYDCDSCKAAFLENIVREWHRVGILLLLVALVFLICSLLVAFRAFRSVK
ncbi:hypothetical protein M569_14011, partial [Genlisea aurea]